MVKYIVYTNSVDLTTDMWKNSPKKYKVKLLKAMGYNTSWANTNNMEELVNRGGGIVAKGIHGLNKEYLKQNGGEVKIHWTNQKDLKKVKW